MLHGAKYRIYNKLSSCSDICISCSHASEHFLVLVTVILEYVNLKHSKLSIHLLSHDHHLVVVILILSHDYHRIA